ncbi:hypothetical protein BCY86_02060 [Pajaroellobacter abortibovis]|uniref:Amine oxidase domain-containing protein n=2 Tax=Pajaroellobacter abortibovis TaxID=1882918 RepID=A0A1L6MVZ1_9BACT|nr:hypothetical protein BCY86_02060 [Pajaroellobacter abortibovis]
MKKHYDVVLLGGGLGVFVAAALLARRSWRVLVIGHDFVKPTYAYEKMDLMRRASTFLGYVSPLWSRFLGELAQSQSFKRRLKWAHPHFQWCAPDLRLDVDPDDPLFRSEVEHLFPEVLAALDFRFSEILRLNEICDPALEQEILWPPSHLWDKWKINRAARSLPSLLQPFSLDSVWHFPSHHPLHAFLSMPVQFATYAACYQNDFPALRLYGAWMKGVGALPCGEEERIAFLCERIQGYGGDVQLGDRVSTILHERGRVTGITVEGEEEVIHTHFLLTSLCGRDLFELGEPDTLSALPVRSLPLATMNPTRWKFVVSMWVHSAALPPAMAPELFLVSRGSHERGEAEGFFDGVHLQVEPLRSSRENVSLLVAEVLLTSLDCLPKAREAVMAVVESFIPFLEMHYLVVDSPHDGRPLWDYRSGERKRVERVSFLQEGACKGAESMSPQWVIDSAPWFYSLGADPIQTPLEGAFLVGPSVFPALGQEGELLAAWSTARLIARLDHQRAKMQWSMRTRIEV